MFSCFFSLFSIRSHHRLHNWMSETQTRTERATSNQCCWISKRKSSQFRISQPPYDDDNERAREYITTTHAIGRIGVCLGTPSVCTTVNDTRIEWKWEREREENTSIHTQTHRGIHAAWEKESECEWRRGRGSRRERQRGRETKRDRLHMYLYCQRLRLRTQYTPCTVVAATVMLLLFSSSLLFGLLVR